MTDDGETIYTADDLRKAEWRTTATAKGKDVGGPFTVQLAETTIAGITVRGSKQKWADGRLEVVYAVHGQTVGSLDEVAAIMSGRWSAGDSAEGRDD